MRAADTNLLVRIIVRDNKQQVAAADQFISDGAWVSVVVLVETTWVLMTTYARDPKEIGDGVEVLLKHRSLVLQDADAVAAALEAYRARPAIQFSDYVILELARKAGHLPLGTFDRRLGALDGAHRL